MATKEKSPNSSPFMGRWPAKPAGGARRPCFSELLPIPGEVAGEAGRRGPRAVLESAAPSPACGGDFPASGEELQRRKAGPKPRIPPHSWGGGRRSRPERPEAVLESAAPSPACGGDFPASGEEFQRKKARAEAPNSSPFMGRWPAKPAGGARGLCLSPRPHPPPAAGTSPRAGKSCRKNKKGPSLRSGPYLVPYLRDADALGARALGARLDFERDLLATLEAIEVAFGATAVEEVFLSVLGLDESK